MFDFFSGGQLLKSVLINQQECIAFVDTPKEHLFLQNYVNLLRQIPHVDKYWKTVEKIHRGS